MAAMYVPQVHPVKLELKWVREDGDGTVCEVCGETCWLNQHRLTLLANGRVCPEIGGAIILCDSCAQEMGNRS